MTGESGLSPVNARPLGKTPGANSIPYHDPGASFQVKLLLSSALLKGFCKAVTMRSP